MHLGHFRHGVKVNHTFACLAKEDEQAANLLAQAGLYRNACYYIIQAMEKLIRAKIFTLVNPKIKFFRDKNKSHSIEAAVDFLVDVVSHQPLVKEQVAKQLKTYVLGQTNYRHLHNNLRYPLYFEKYENYSVLEVGKEDYQTLCVRLESLKKFLEDLHKVN